MWAGGQTGPPFLPEPSWTNSQGESQVPRALDLLTPQPPADELREGRQPRKPLAV